MAKIGDVQVEILVRVNEGELHSLGAVRVPLMVRHVHNPNVVQMDLSSEFSIVAEYLNAVFGREGDDDQESPE